MVRNLFFAIILALGLNEVANAQNQDAPPVQVGVPQSEQNVDQPVTLTGAQQQQLLQLQSVQQQQQQREAKVRQEAQVSGQKQAQVARLDFLKQHPRSDKTKGDFIKGNENGWLFVQSQCADPTTDVCAQASIAEVSLECQASAKFFRRDSKAWNIIGFSLVMASAAFTAVGASTTVANATIFSTLGGTTGLGAVTANTKANVTGDTTAILALNATVAAFAKYVETGGDGNSAAPNNLIFKVAPLYAGQCATVATGTGSGS